MPSRTPEQRLHRLLAVARIDALSLLVLAGPATLAALALRERFAAGIGLVITLCGMLEWAGQRTLRQRQPRGLGWMLAAQAVCLLAILVYARHLGAATRPDHILKLLPSFTREQLAMIFPTPEDTTQFVLSIQRLTLALVALAAVVYQGGMMFYYLRARRHVAAWLATPPPLDASGSATGR